MTDWLVLAEDAHMEIGLALLRSEEMPEEVAAGLRVAMAQISKLIEDLRGGE